MSTATYAASSAPGPRGSYAGQHRNRMMPRIGKALVVLTAFVLSATALTGGLLLLIDAGADVTQPVLAVPLTLIALGGASFVAMLFAFWADES